MLNNRVYTGKEEVKGRARSSDNFVKDLNGEKTLLPEEKYHNLTPRQWQWAVTMIKEFELNEDGARILIEEIKKGNFVFD